MNDSVAITVRGISKKYKLYRSQDEMLKDWMFFYKLQFWKDKHEFPIKNALDDINLTINKGDRVGLIGRNGAGKTTLLKIISGMIKADDGKVMLNGRVQSLMRTGGGFHPDLTGADNVKNSLLYNGLRGEALKEAYEDVLDFAELGDYIHQPVQNYSLGMATRLGFAVATAITPDILIIDEVLGAGDSYFATKSVERMKKLTGSGCTLLLVSHSRGQIMEFCDKAVWLDNGKVKKVGDVDEVTAAYDRDLVREESVSARAEVNETESKDTYIDPPEFMKKQSYQEKISNFVKEQFGASQNDANILKGIDCYGPDGNSNQLSTGDSCRLDIHFDTDLLKDQIDQNIACDVLFFDEGADLVASSSCNSLSDENLSTGKVSVDLSPCALGYRLYFLVIVLRTDNVSIDILTNFVIRITDTNDSDPPLLHCPAFWFFNNCEDASEGRISGIQ